MRKTLSNVLAGSLALGGCFSEGPCYDGNSAPVAQMTHYRLMGDVFEPVGILKDGDELRVKAPYDFDVSFNASYDPDEPECTNQHTGPLCLTPLWFGNGFLPQQGDGYLYQRYTSPGTYSVSLEVRDRQGCADVATVRLIVE